MGVKKGDVVTIYMPMVPELATAMVLRTDRAAHSVIFGGFTTDGDQRAGDRCQEPCDHYGGR